MKPIIRTFLLVTLLASAFSCQEDDKETTISCGVTDPANNLAWMKEMIDSWAETDLYTYFYIVQGDYVGQTVFMTLDCCPFCDTISPVLDCEGNILWYGAMEPDKTNLIHDMKVIWKPLGSQCNID